MNDLTTRKMAVAPRGPQTLDEDARTVDAVMTTEAPAKVVDWDRWEIVDEILILDGAQYAKQLPLLNSHDRSGVEQVLGSVREIRRDGEGLVGTVHFSSVPEADSALTKVREGHLTDFSIGYTVQESVWVPEGQSYTLNGKAYEGPVKLSTKFEIKELSICPIGADKLAKARAAANLNPKEEPIMEPKDEGRSPVATPTPAPAVPTVDEGKIRADVESAERARAAELMAMGRKFDCMDLAVKAVADGTTVSAFNGVVLDHMAAKQSAPAPLFRIEAGEVDQDKFRAAAVEGLQFRALKGGKANEFTGMTLRELARECLIRAGVRAGYDPMAMIGRAFTSSDFPYILENTAHKSVAEGYEGANETWREWCGVGIATDFKTHSIVRPSGTSGLVQIVEGGEYKHGQMDEAREQYALGTYGALFAISRQAIINDDMGVFTDLPMDMGEASAALVGDVAYAVLTANAAMGDGTALFDTSVHKNLASSGGAISVSTVGAGEAAMLKQTTANGKRKLNIRPAFWLGPVALKALADQFFASLKEGTQAKPELVNPYAGVIKPIVDARLDDASATNWYLAGPKGKFVKVFFLNGQEAPRVETKQGWTIDGVEFKVSVDVAGKAVDWRTGYKNPQ